MQYDRTWDQQVETVADRVEDEICELLMNELDESEAEGFRLLTEAKLAVEAEYEKTRKEPPCP